jgi:HEAT repeat protein
MQIECKNMKRKGKKIFSAILLVLLLLNATYAQEASESGETGEPGEEEGVSLYEKWEQSLLYGIDTSVTATIDEMIDAKDDEFEDEVLELLGSRRSILRNKALDFFEALESNRAIETVLGELNFYQDLNSSFVVRMINHLQRREQPIDEDLWDLLREIIDEEGRDVQLAAISYLGALQYAPAAGFLGEMYEDPDTGQAIREALLRALGSIRDPETADLIFDLASDENIDKTQRIAALEAAGKYADDRAMRVLGDTFSSEDPLIRSAAIGSLSEFPVGEVKDLYLEALRDSFWRIRLSALRGIADNPFSEALEPLQYMSRQDPENNVRTQAFRSIAALDERQAWVYLREALTDEDLAVPFRQTVAVEIIRGNFGPSKTEIQEVMVEQWEEENSVLLDTICKELSTNDLPGADDLYQRMLGHENFIIQIYGVRGIGRNGILRFKSDLEAIVESDESHPALKSNASSALEQL